VPVLLLQVLLTRVSYEVILFAALSMSVFLSLGAFYITVRLVARNYGKKRAIDKRGR
jgi:hypothetical protein